MVIDALTDLFRYLLQPIAPFTWFGLQISTLDVAATFRLCVLLRQIRDSLHAAHISAKGHAPVEAKSFVKSASTTLMVVYGGEAITSPLLGVPPSFMVSGSFPALYTLVQAFVDGLPSVPALSPELEFPLSIFDGLTRAYLLCNLIPPAVVANPNKAIAESPWTLLVSSLVTANAGFFFTNLFSFLHPTPLTLQTPPELQPYGWTTVDLWCAPTITGLYALLTHAQPFWADLHSVLIQLLGGVQDGARGFGKTPKPLDPETARVVCALLLSGLFTGRTIVNFGLLRKWKGGAAAAQQGKSKEKTQ